jgi:DNA-binding protein HU-beta
LLAICKQRIIQKEDAVMNKTELIAAVASAADLTKKDAEKFLSAFENVVTKALVDGKKVQLVGFMTLDVVERAQREGRNPQTGQPMTIAASKAPRFKVGKKLRDAVNGK